VTTIPSVSLENIQDLKAGQIVGATPWKQQLILILGVVVSALVIAPVLNLLFHAYGMGGVFPREGMDPSQMLPAPQAGLMATIAKGVLSHDINWLMVNIGGVIAILGIIIDEFLKRKHKRFVVLAMGLSIYLPFSISAPLFLGTFISYLAKRRLKKENKREGQSGILLACGLVAGSALMGVFLAIPFVIYGNSNALSIVSASFEPIAVFLGVIITVALCYWIYRTASLEKV